jgi:trimethyllysine dioxygenase
MATISEVEVEQSGAWLTVADERRFFSWMWLRDHSREDSDFDPVTNQRLRDSFADGEVGPAEVVVAADGESLTVSWEGSKTVRYDAAFLISVTNPEGRVAPVRDRAVAWSDPPAIERVGYDQYLADDHTLFDALCSVARDGAVLVEGVPTDREATRLTLERIGYLRASVFGTLWDIRSGGEFDDTGSTTLEVPPHTDGTYSHDAPGLAGFHCITKADSGGATVLVDGLQVAQQLAEHMPASYAVLCQTDVVGQYLGDGAHLVAQRPVFRRDDRGRVVQVSYNNLDRAPMLLPAADMARLYDALGDFAHLIREPELQMKLVLEPGEMLIFDNWRLLHSRRAFTGDRHFTGAYLNHEDFESRLRTLG